MYNIILENKMLRLVVSSALSIISILLLFFIVKGNLRNLNEICLWILAVIYYGLFNYFIAFNYRIQNFKSVKNPFIPAIISLVVSVILILVLPISYNGTCKNNSLERLLSENKNIEIKPIGEKNTSSSGYKVIIEGIVENGKDVNTFGIPMSKNWALVDARPTSEDKNAEGLLIPYNYSHSLKIKMRYQPDAGMIKVTLGSNSHVYDLYSNNSHHKNLDLNELITMENSLSIKSIIFYIIYLLILNTAVSSLVSYLYSRKLLKNKVMQKYV